MAPVDWKSDTLPLDPACSAAGFCFVISVTSLGPNTGNDDDDDDDFSAVPILGVLLFQLQPANEIKFLPPFIQTLLTTQTDGNSVRTENISFVSLPW
jgi:hypothetical protein